MDIPATGSLCFGHPLKHRALGCCLRGWDGKGMELTLSHPVAVATDDAQHPCQLSICRTPICARGEARGQWDGAQGTYCLLEVLVMPCLAGVTAQPQSMDLLQVCCAQAPSRSRLPVPSLRALCLPGGSSNHMQVTALRAAALLSLSVQRCFIVLGGDGKCQWREPNAPSGSHHGCSCRAGSVCSVLITPLLPYALAQGRCWGPKLLPG